jgi:hypothetical protein
VGEHQLAAVPRAAALRVRRARVGAAARTLDLVRRGGFFEYFHPDTGEGLGSASFSWTAALVLDFLAED